MPYLLIGVAADEDFGCQPDKLAKFPVKSPSPTQRLGSSASEKYLSRI
jgi:hypothetical protein